MADIACRTCSAGDGTHERWCAVGHRIAEMAGKDARIAELEAQVAQLEAKSDDFDAEMTIVAKAVDAAFGDGRLDPKDKANAQLADIAESKKWMTEQVDDTRERIAELEAALRDLLACPRADIADELHAAADVLNGASSLDAALAKARRETLEAAAEFCRQQDHWWIANMLRRMARGVKP